MKFANKFLTVVAQSRSVGGFDEEFHILSTFSLMKIKILLENE